MQPGKPLHLSSFMLYFNDAKMLNSARTAYIEIISFHILNDVFEWSSNLEQSSIFVKDWSYNYFLWWQSFIIKIVNIFKYTIVYKKRMIESSSAFMFWKEVRVHELFLLDVECSVMKCLFRLFEESIRWFD